MREFKNEIIKETEKQVRGYVESELDKSIMKMDIILSGSLYIEDVYLVDDIEHIEQFIKDSQYNYNIPEQKTFNRIMLNVLNIFKDVQSLIYS